MTSFNSLKKEISVLKAVKPSSEIAARAQEINELLREYERVTKEAQAFLTPEEFRLVEQNTIKQTLEWYTKRDL